MRPGWATRPRRAGRLALPLLLALVPGAAAQRPGCDYGAALADLAAADRAQAAAPGWRDLAAAREGAAGMAARLRAAEATLAGCGCALAAGAAGEAAAVAEAAGSESGLPGIRARLDRAGFSLRLARERLAGRGCS